MYATRWAVETSSHASRAAWSAEEKEPLSRRASQAAAAASISSLLALGFMCRLRPSTLPFAAFAAAKDCLRQRPNSAAQLTFDGPLVQPKTLGRVPLREPLYPPQPDDITAFVGQGIERCRKSMQFLAGPKMSFGRHLINEDVRVVKIRHRLDGNDAAVTNPIGHQIARGGEQEGLGRGGPATLGTFVDTNIDVLAQVGYVGGIRPNTGQIPDQQTLKRENFRGEPLIQVIEHPATIPRRYREM